MSRINSNVPALVALSHLSRSQAGLQTTLERLSSGLRINRGADDPAGLIVSENLRSEIAGIHQAVSNSQRAANIVATAEGALNEAAALLNDVQNLIVESANRGAVSDEEIRANQLQVDSAIESITRIANSTTFAGRRLLDGSLDYVASGVRTSAIANLRINNASFGTTTFIPVTIQVTQSAQRGQLFFTASAVAIQTTIEIAGNNGVTSLSFASATTASAIRNAINQVSDTTGVTARLINAGNPNSGIVLESAGFGTKSFVRVEPLPTSTGGFTVSDSTGAVRVRDEGRDARVSVNGASTLGDGLEIKLNTSGLGAQFTLQQAFNKAGTTTFAITGGGALFQLGAGVNSNEQKSLGIGSVAATRLGDSQIGFLSQMADGEAFALTKGQAATAQKIVNAAIKQIASLRGRLGAFEKNTLDTNISQLGITLENLTAAESSIRDVDFAEETSQLTRFQILTQAGTAVLKIANQVPAQVLSLLQ